MEHKPEVANPLYLLDVSPLILTFLVLIQFVLYVNGCRPGQGTVKEGDIGRERIFIYCSKPLKPVVSAIARIYEAQHNVSPTIASASDAALLSMLRHTKTGDLFVSMSRPTVDAIERENLVRQIRTIALADPVLAVSPQGKEGITSLEQICADGCRVGVVGSKGNELSETTRRICTRTGVWEKLQGNIVIKAKSSSELLRLLKLDAIDAAIVWNPEESSKIGDISVIALPNTETLRGKLRIILLGCSKIPTRARAFVEVALSDEASSALRRQGFASNAPALTEGGD